MADESPPTAGKRFSEDLRQIREERGISVEEIQEETQIAETLIRSFEEGRLYDHPTYNRVYLRSFIRAYADALNISRSEALDGLDAALNGTYEDALASQYLGGPRSTTDRRSDPSSEPNDRSGEDVDDASDPSIDVQDAPTAGGPEGRGGIVGPPRAVGEPPPEEHQPPSYESADEEHSADPAAGGSTEDEEIDTPDAEGPPEPSGDTVSSPEPISTPSEDEEGEEGSPTGSDEERDEQEDPADTPDWMAAPDESDEEARAAKSTEPSATPSSPSGPGETEDMPVGGDELGVVGEPSAVGSSTPAPEDPGPETGSPSAGRSRSAYSGGWIELVGGQNSLYLTGAGIAVVLLVLVGLGVAYFTAGGEEPAATGPQSPDTTVAAARADTTDGSSRPAPANVSIGSSIDLLVLARTNVSGIRLQRDDDLRRPYWIQEGEADVFPFQETVTIENGLSDVRLFIEGYPYPVRPSDTTDGLQITRAQVEAFVDTLRGAAPSLSVSPDTIPVGTPTP